MQNPNNPLDTSRVKTDKSLKGERHKTDDFIEVKTSNVEEVADEKTRLNRAAADKSLAESRAQSDTPAKSPDKDIVNERKLSDIEIANSRLEEDRIRNKERFQKRMIADSLLESERKETDSSLLNEREQIDTAHDLTKTELVTRDQFLAVVNHDLRNPLSTINMGVQLLRTAISDGESKENLIKFLEIIERNADVMDRLITDLLDIERISNNKLFLNNKLNNIGDLLKECEELFAPVILNKSLTMKVENSPEQLFAEIDHDKIIQVVSNLIGNAIKFSPPGSLITLSARKSENTAEISVSDNGPGIPKDKLAEIFERFSQIKKNDRRGLGLGLFISKWIVEAHKGRIWVNSEPDQGSTFTFTLPINTKH